MLMSVLEMIWSITVVSYAFWFTTISIPLRPYTSWADVHSNFSRIDTYPTLFMPELVITGYYFLWWLIPISTLAFVAMFAFGRDAVEEYRRAFEAVANFVFRRVPGGEKKNTKAGFGALSSTRSLELAKYATSTTTPSSPSSTSKGPLPPYALPTPPSPHKFRAAFDDIEFDDVSVSSSHGPALSYQGGAGATPTFIAYPSRDAEDAEEPETASTLAFGPPRLQPHAQARPQPRTAGTRPVTYPSFDAARRGAQ
jgi:pheromone a factor receptor